MATIQGKATPPRAFANFMGGVLEGFLQGRNMAMEGRAQQKREEVQAAELKAAELDQQLKQAQLDEFQATKLQRRLMSEAELKAAQATNPIELKRLAVDTARANADAARARARREELELQKEQQLNEFTDFLNKLRSSMSGGEETSMAPPGVEGKSVGFDARDVPAGEEPVMGTVSGGKRVLTGPPRPGDLMEEEATVPFVRPGEVARSILPPSITIPGQERKIPISTIEVEAALKSKDMNDALRRLMTTEGVPFGAELAKLKQDDPAAYMKKVTDLVDEHEKMNKATYDAYKDKATRVSNIRRRVLEILTDPYTRGIQNPIVDLDAAVSEAVAEESTKVLLSGSRVRFRDQLSVDAASDGNEARYNGRLLNNALDEVFGTLGQAVRFSEDKEYTLRQIITALYSDEYSAAGTSLIGFDRPLREGMFRPADHPIIDVLDAYWDPVFEMERRSKLEKMAPTRSERQFFR